jgi:Sugar-transfer associated ATP-grasp
MKYAFCPIHDFYRLRKTPPRQTDRVHRLYAKAYSSRSRTGSVLRPSKRAWRQAKIVFQSLAWPLFCVCAVVSNTVRYGQRARAAGGAKLGRQIVDQLQLGLGEGVPPRSYYLFSMFQPERKSLAPAFVHYHENNYLAALFVSPRERSILDDKLRFHDFCAGLDLPTPPVVAHFCEGRQQGGELPEADLIVKPVDGFAGGSIEAWTHAGPGQWLGPGQLRLDRAALATRLAQRSRAGAALVQPRLRNHVDLDGLSKGGLCTARMVTVRSPGARPELVIALLRMPRGDAIVDNFAAGGIACPLDVETGRVLRAAVDWKPMPEVFERHPDTGRKLIGLQLPGWATAVDLCLRAHEALETCPAVGWDVGFTEQGPVLVEGNVPFGIELTQFVSGTPLLTTAFLGAHLDFERRYT